MALEAMPVYIFGPFQLDIGERELKRDGEVVQLTRKAFETLAHLVQNRGRVLSKDEMMQSIWPNSFVEEATLAQNIFTLRRVLGETPLEAHYIETVPRRGYRFIAEVIEVSPAPGTRQADEPGGGGSSLKSIAVLPFKMLTAEVSNEYFGLGMADALITRLSNIRDIIVRPTSAVLKYHRKDQDLYTTGRELKTQLALDGSIQRLDDRIRVTVQLVNVESGAPLWADKFDERFSDIFAVQDTISERVVDALTLELTSAQKRRLTKRYTGNSEAYRHYVKGRYLWNKWTVDGFKKSIESYQKAIELEPGYALAYVGVADAYTSLGFYGHMVPSQVMPKVKANALKALELDSQVSEARLPLAAALFYYDWDWEGAERELRRSIDAGPGYANAYQMYGLYLIAMRRFTEASANLDLALEIDPVSPLIKTTAGFPYYYSGDYEKAIEHFKATLEEDPYFGLAHVALAEVYLQQERYDEAIEHYNSGLATWGERLVLPYLGHAYAAAGRKAEALNALQRLEEASLKQYVSPFSMAIVYAGLQAENSTYEWLEKAYEERSNRLVFLGVQPIFKRLHSQPRFKDLLARIGLPPT
jgi:DNA-binding winged helix-turn-helix (wHTH) protein/tetratricopeptide (TPR) repeat protein